MRKLFPCLVVTAVLALPAPGFADELKLTIDGGLVSINAENVPVSRLLAEWARLGKAKIVGGEQVNTPVSLHLENVPERKALDIILRSVAGYMVAERPVRAAGASVYDRIMILPTSRPPANSPVVQAPPAWTPPQVRPDVDDDPAQPPPMPPGMQPPPVQPQPGQSNAPLTAPRPGQLPAPPSGNQPVPFGAPPKPPGGGGPGGGPGGR